MKNNFFSKIQIFFNSRKIFKNWYIYPKMYYKFTNEKYVIFETKTGLKIKIRTNSTDLMALTNVWMLNEYAVEDFQLAKNDTIIDVGAHIGLFSLLVSQFCKTGKIFSFEPISDNFNLLMSNLKLNHTENIHPFNLAVSKNTSSVDLFLSSDQSAHSIFSSDSEPTTVKSISLQRIFDENKISSCKLLKLDCEGAEYEIIDSLPLEYFDKIENIAIEYHVADSKPELAKDLISKIKNAGFTIKTRPHHNDMGFLIATK
tara:strand:+ start:80 stop:853 length:774 start_codon:yes stop_codon:yes gene_type:complete